MKPHYHVVAAVVCRDGRFLCMQKGETKYAYTRFKWEFPGGKIEQGETPQAALRRELLEEMDFPVVVGCPVATVTHHYPDFSITMTAYRCTADTANFKLKEHAAFKWCRLKELSELDWAAADVAIVDALRNGADD